MMEQKITVLINSASHVQELALVQGEHIIGEWILEEDQKGEAQWIEQLERALTEKEIEKRQLQAIHVVTGPGPFTALRVGLAFANALRYGLNLEMETSTTFELLDAKLQAAGAPAALCGLHAGGSEAAIPQNTAGQAGGFELMSLDKLLDLVEGRSLCFEGNARSRQMLLQKKEARGASFIASLLWPEHLPSFAQVKTRGFLNGHPSTHAVSQYLRGAHITVSKDPWKQTDKVPSTPISTQT